MLCMTGCILTSEVIKLRFRKYRRFKTKVVVHDDTENLTFRGPCIMMYTYNKTKELHEFLKFIFGIEFYTFRTVSLSIIRSLALYTQQYI
jgi:hypothetical protein